MNEYSVKFPNSYIPLHVFLGVVFLLGVMLLCVSVWISGCGEQERPTPTEPVILLPDRYNIYDNITYLIRNKL